MVCCLESVTNILLEKCLINVNHLFGIDVFDDKKVNVVDICTNFKTACTYKITMKLKIIILCNYVA